ncbi:MAG: hypothetical protein KGJ90_04155 [Patescibacteria group bacterium]|nr:hypothetical protein [Patescibacteria group bacterium]
MADLTTKKRKALSNKSFALKKKREYPIEDKLHARNALSRASQFASPENQAKIEAAVHNKFPGIKIAALKNKKK